MGFSYERYTTAYPFGVLPVRGCGVFNLIPFIGAVIPGFVPILGLIMLVAGVTLGYRPSGILRKERAIEEWSVLVDEGNGQWPR